MRFAAVLIEAVDFCKSKIKELEKIDDNFVEVITDLEESNFTDPDKDTILKKVQTEQDEYEDKHDEILKKNEQTILQADNVLTGTKTAPSVIALPEETAGNLKWRNFKPQTSLKLIIWRPFNS